MGPGDDEEDEDFSDPLPRADRVWRHPAEMAAEGRLAGRQASRRRRRGSVLFFAASALSGAGVVLLALAAIGEFSDDAATPVASATSLVEPEVGQSPPTTSTFDDVSQAEASIAAVIRVRARTGGSTAYASGVFLPADGHVLTSAAVVTDATDVTVWLDGGVELPGTVVGIDAANDIAVVRVPGAQMPHAVLGTSRGLAAGDAAVIIDASGPRQEGVRLTVSSVIATGRRVDLADHTMHGMVQLDVPGDLARAGIVLASDGRVVGLLSTQAASAGYAISIDWAMRIADDLIAVGEVRHAWLGIDGTDVRTSDASAYAATEGARVVEVDPTSPAAGAGLRANDVIVAIDDAPVRSMSDLVLAVRPHRPGDAVKVRYLRDGEERVCEPVLATAGDRGELALSTSSN